MNVFGTVIVGRGCLTFLFYEDPPYIAYSPFLKFCSTPAPLPPTSTPTALFVVLFFLAEWVIA